MLFISVNSTFVFTINEMKSELNNKEGTLKVQFKQKYKF
jgi:hypothetical protein